ncbi:hypothetical protein [Bradyrhizobium sp. S3.5.5]
MLSRLVQLGMAAEQPTRAGEARRGALRSNHGLDLDRLGPSPETR